VCRTTRFAGAKKYPYSPLPYAPRSPQGCGCRPLADRNSPRSKPGHTHYLCLHAGRGVGAYLVVAGQGSCVQSNGAVLEVQVDGGGRGDRPHRGRRIRSSLSWKHVCLLSSANAVESAYPGGVPLDLHLSAPTLNPYDPYSTPAISTRMAWMVNGSPTPTTPTPPLLGSRSVGVGGDHAGKVTG
jgi:hypothetical protein